MFEKFLKGNPSEPKAEEGKTKRKRAGRPPLPDELRRYPKRHTERHDAKGRVKRSERKGMPAGSKHWAAKRKKMKLASRRRRAKWGLAKDLAYNKTLKRKYIQNRSVARIKAKERGLNPAQWHTITYEEWLVLWASAPDVWHEGAFRRPASVVSNPVKCQWKCCYVDRLDKTQAYTRDNMAVFYDRKPLVK